MRAERKKIGFSPILILNYVSVSFCISIANVCYDADLFKTAPEHDIGPYHKNMIPFECGAPSGGLLGEVKILKIQN